MRNCYQQVYSLALLFLVLLTAAQTVLGDSMDDLNRLVQKRRAGEEVSADLAQRCRGALEMLATRPPAQVAEGASVVALDASCWLRHATYPCALLAGSSHLSELQRERLTRALFVLTWHWWEDLSKAPACDSSDMAASTGDGWARELAARLDEDPSAARSALLLQQVLTLSEYRAFTPRMEATLGGQFLSLLVSAPLTTSGVESQEVLIANVGLSAFDSRAAYASAYGELLGGLQAGLSPPEFSYAVQRGATILAQGGPRVARLVQALYSEASRDARIQLLSVLSRMHADYGTSVLAELLAEHPGDELAPLMRYYRQSALSLPVSDEDMEWIRRFLGYGEGGR